MATYYIRIDTYWANSPDYFVGPFSNKLDARREIERARDEGSVWLSTRLSGDLKDGIRVHGINTKTNCVRVWRMKEEDIIGKRIPKSATELHRIINAVNY